MKKLLKLIIKIISLLPVFFVATPFLLPILLSYRVITTRFFPDVDPQKCPINKKIDFRNISQCKYRVWGGWQDGPYLVKARGEFSMCNNFPTKETSAVEINKITVDDSINNKCFSTDINAFKSIPCQDVAIPSRYRCFACDVYPLKAVYGFGSNCSDSVIYFARGLNLKYLSKQIPLEFESVD